MGCAPMAHVLWKSIMSYNPANPKWSNRDRFVLSNGHACALQYSMLHLTGYDLSIDDCKAFRQLHSKTPGHPESFATPGIEVCTGPLGQGISNAVGLAIAETHLAAEFNKEGFNIVDHYTFVICGDGCLQEGVSSEACSLAGHLGLGKLIVLYDDNLITIDGSTNLSFTEDVAARYKSYGWDVVELKDGTDTDALQKAVEDAKNVTDKPTMIKIRTVIGQGSLKEGTHGIHGAPLKPDDLAQLKEKAGLDPAKKFQCDDEVYGFYDNKAGGAAAEAAWQADFKKYAEKHPELGAQYERRMLGQLPEGWKKNLPVYKVGDDKKATRVWSGLALNAVAECVPELMGGSADLTPSNNTWLTCSSDYQKDSRGGRYIRFGVREHGMAAICNGITAHGGIIPYCATFLNFMGYAFGASRLSALSKFGVLYIFTHDSIGLGEDGPTHQPVEMMMQCRSIPNLNTLRPADGNEVSGCYAVAMESRGRPSVFCLSRQGLPVLEGSSCDKVAMGAYVLQDCAGKPDIILVGTGSETHLCVNAKNAITDSKIRVVSLPCWELFDEQTDAYKQSVLTPGVPVMSVEAGCTLGWAKYSHAQVGVDTFGASAPGGACQKEFGITTENVTEKAKAVLKFYSGKAAPDLIGTMGPL
jgi:transketolase